MCILLHCTFPPKTYSLWTRSLQYLFQMIFHICMQRMFREYSQMFLNFHPVYMTAFCTIPQNVISAFTAPPVSLHRHQWMRYRNPVLYPDCLCILSVHCSCEVLNIIIFINRTASTCSCHPCPDCPWTGSMHFPQAYPVIPGNPHHAGRYESTHQHQILQYRFFHAATAFSHVWVFQHSMTGTLPPIQDDVLHLHLLFRSPYKFLIFTTA